MDIERVIANHSKVFRDMPKGLPLARYHDHTNNLKLKNDHLALVLILIQKLNHNNDI